jgi:hypothetical protein
MPKMRQQEYQTENFFFFRHYVQEKLITDVISNNYPSKSCAGTGAGFLFIIYRTYQAVSLQVLPTPLCPESASTSLSFSSSSTGLYGFSIKCDPPLIRIRSDSSESA